VEEGWSTFKNVVFNSSLKHLGRTECRHQDWFDENNIEIQSLLDERRRLHKACLNDTSFSSKKEAFVNARQTPQSKL